MSDLPNPRENELLAALPDEAWQRWFPALEAVDLPLGAVLFESGDTPTHVYFPTTCVVALLYSLKDRSSAEIAVVGNEGVVGISLFMGGHSTSSRAVVQCAGKGFRLGTQLMMEEFHRGGAVLHLLLRYTQALVTQMFLTAACNRHHSSDQQMCRWLLVSLDHLSMNELVTTKVQIANMIGARREHVTDLAHRTDKDHAFRTARGQMALLDRELLLTRTCECYGVITREYGRLLPRTLAT